MKLYILYIFVTLCVSIISGDDNPIIINDKNVTDVPTPSTVPVNITTVTPPPTTTPNTTTTTVTPPSTTTTAPTTTTPITPPPTNATTTSSTTSTTVSPPTNATSTTQATTIAPTPSPHKGRKFDGASFIGGIILAVGLMAICFVSWKFYKARTERNYHTL